MRVWGCGADLHHTVGVLELRDERQRRSVLGRRRVEGADGQHPQHALHHHGGGAGFTRSSLGFTNQSGFMLWGFDVRGVGLRA